MQSIKGLASHCAKQCLKRSPHSAAALSAGALAPAQLAGSQPAAAAPTYDWVALGDSYTAGVIPAVGDIFETPSDGCARTDKSYPQVIDRELGNLIRLTNVNCGAATIEDINSRYQNPIGRHMPPFSRDPDYPFAWVPPQSEAVNPDTDVVTVGAGGNTRLPSSTPTPKATATLPATSQPPCAAPSA